MWIYLILRLFVAKKNYYLEGDELRHLTTARNFYRLWNKHTYDTHPPLYSWLMSKVGWFGIFSGVIVSFLCSIGLYIVCSRLYDVLGLTVYEKTIALMFLAFNYTLIYYSNRTFRYQLIALLGTAMVYFMVIHNWIAAGLVWGLLGLTCTFAGLRGIFIWMFLGFNPITLITFCIVYSSWLFEKIKLYTDHEYYPAGIDGKIERVKDFNLKQLFSPLYFNWSYAYYGKRELGYDFKNWPIKIGWVFGLYKGLWVLIPIVLCFVIIGAFNSPLWVSLIVVCLLYPSLLKRFLARNSIIAIPLIGILLAKGVPEVPLEGLFFGFLAILGGFLWFNRAFMLTVPKVKTELTSWILKSLASDGILAEGLIAYAIAYESEKRVVVLSHDPDKEKAIYQTDLAIKEFNLHYAVISELYKTDMHLGYPAIDYIKTFPLIKIIKEDNDEYYVYELS